MQFRSQNEQSHREIKYHDNTEKIENILLQLETYVKEKQKINQRRLTESGHHRSEIMPSLMAQVDVNVIIRINIYRKKQYRYKRQKWF